MPFQWSLHMPWADFTMVLEVGVRLGRDYGAHFTDQKPETQ